MNRFNMTTFLFMNTSKSFPSIAMDKSLKALFDNIECMNDNNKNLSQINNMVLWTSFPSKKIWIKPIMIAYCGSMKQLCNTKMCFKLFKLNDFFWKIEILKGTLYNSWKQHKNIGLNNNQNIVLYLVYSYFNSMLTF